MIVFRLYSVLPRHVVNKTGCNLLIEMHYFERQGGGGYSSKFLVGVCRLVLKILTLFQTVKNCNFPNPFSDQTSKIHIPVSKPVLQAEIMLALLSLERKQNYSSNPIRIRKFLFLSYSFGIETINTFIPFRSSLDNHTRFQTKTAQKPYPMGWHIPVY